MAETSEVVAENNNNVTIESNGTSDNVIENKKSNKPVVKKTPQEYKKELDTIKKVNPKEFQRILTIGNELIKSLEVLSKDVEKSKKREQELTDITSQLEITKEELKTLNNRVQNSIENFRNENQQFQKNLRDKGVNSPLVGAKKEKQKKEPQNNAQSNKNENKNKPNDNKNNNNNKQNNNNNNNKGNKQNINDSNDKKEDVKANNNNSPNANKKNNNKKQNNNANNKQNNENKGKNNQNNNKNNEKANNNAVAAESN